MGWNNPAPLGDSGAGEWFLTIQAVYRSHDYGREFRLNSPPQYGLRQTTLQSVPQYNLSEPMMRPLPFRQRKRELGEPAIEERMPLFYADVERRGITIKSLVKMCAPSRVEIQMHVLLDGGGAGRGTGRVDAVEQRSPPSKLGREPVKWFVTQTQRSQHPFHRGRNVGPETVVNHDTPPRETELMRFGLLRFGLRRPSQFEELPLSDRARQGVV